jgi:DNA modification methylase
MVKYSCEKCGKEFTQKGHYTKHTTKKNPCVFESKIEEIIEKVVAEKMIKINYDYKNNETKVEQNETKVEENETKVEENETKVEENETKVEPSNTYKITTTDYTIINSCCIKGLTDMKNDNKKIHLTITSPPYYNVKDYVSYTDYKEYLNTLKNVFTLIYEITEDGRMCCVNLSNILIQRENRNSESSRIPLAFHFVPLMEEIGWKFIEDIIWVKPEGSAKNRNGGFYQHRQPVAYKPNIINEYIFIFQKPSKFLIDKIVRGYDAITSLNSKVNDGYERTNVWKINPETKSKHPAPYPELLVANLIKYYSFCGDLILDPFVGSGTTLISAFKLNRKSIGFEIHKDYITIFENRIKNITKQSTNQSISINKDDYVNLNEDQIKKKINKFNKKHLYQLVNNDCKYKSYSKDKLINLIYVSNFMNSA